MTDGYHTHFIEDESELFPVTRGPNALPTPITWEERVKAASVPYRTGRDAYSQPVRKLVASILRAAFPEMAPND
jgi:hypothetical protein